MTTLSKVKVSTIKNKEYHDLSCSYDGTSNFGAVFPSFARELMPKGKFSVSVGSKILNAPMPVPTMGEMYINHKHVFIPYVDVCPQYQSFLTAQSYTIPGGDSYVPTQLCKLDLPMLAQYILSYFADFTVYTRHTQLDDPTYDEKTEFEPFLFKRGYNQDDLDDAKDIFNAIWYPDSGSNYFYGKSIAASGSAKVDSVTFDDALNLMPLGPITRDGYVRNANSICGQWLAGDFAFCGDREMSTSSNWWKFNGNVPIEGIDISSSGQWQPSQGYVDISTADVVSLFGPTSGLTDYAIAFKLRSTGKRLFSILLGLNYQFTPNLEDLVDDVNWLKLLAFYKSWFNIYRPKRQMSFTQTNCYKLIKLMELPDADSELYPSAYEFADLVKEFIWDLALDPYYYFKQDYYGMSTLTPNADYSEDGGQLITSHLADVAPNVTNDSDGVYIDSSYQPTVTMYSENYDTINSPALMKIAMGILKHINKNTIIGKDIAAFIKAHFGISLDTSHDLDKVYLIGEVSENIDISPVMSMAGTDTDELGAYAGRGYGESNDGNEFVFENKNDTHGVWITLSCVIPKSGYTQGIHRENRSLKRFDFPQSDLDALGYEVLARDEVSADYPVCTLRFNPHTYSNFDRKKAFGFVPRQSAFKFGQNVVAGELALRSGKSQFSGYHLNRVIPYEKFLYSTIYDDEGNAKIFSTIYAPGYVPNVIHDEFRKIDPTDRLGNFNRVFYDESVNSDHFIVHFGFKVDAWLPLLSMSDSFDTYQDNTDSVKMVHS